MRIAAIAQDRARSRLARVVVLLGVSFLGEVVNWEGNNDILPLGAGIALVIAALGFILWLTPAKHEDNDARET